MNQAKLLTRRTMVGWGAALAGVTAARAQPVLPAGRALAFEMWRKQHKIGRHSIAFKGDAKTFVVTIEATVKVAIGLLTVYQSHCEAAETWVDGRFASFRSHTLTNGKSSSVQATRGGDGVLIKTATASHLAPLATLPLTHWNRQALQGPLFDFQSGALLHETLASQGPQSVRLADGRSVAANGYAIAGDLNIAFWYDAQDDLAAMRVKVMDGSLVDYRRTA